MDNTVLMIIKVSQLAADGLDIFGLAEMLVRLVVRPVVEQLFIPNLLSVSSPCWQRTRLVEYDSA